MNLQKLQARARKIKPGASYVPDPLKNRLKTFGLNYLKIVNLCNHIQSITSVCGCSVGHSSLLARDGTVWNLMTTRTSPWLTFILVGTLQSELQSLIDVHTPYHLYLVALTLGQ